MLCKIAESSLHSTSVRGNYQKDVRSLKELFTVEQQEKQ